MTNKLLLALTLMLLVVTAHTQAPQGLNYQAVARNASGGVVQNQSIGIEFSILSGSGTGTVVYQETNTATTNEFGLFTAVIGSGTPVTGTLSGVSWGSASMFLTVAIDPTGGTSYTTMGTTQLQSVPYALFAANGGWSTTGNAGLSASANFIGTTDATPLEFKVNDQVGGFIDYNSAQTFLGWDAGAASLAGGTYNVGIGSVSLFRNTTGTYNTAVGHQAVELNTTGSNNTGIGYDALAINNANNNTAVGSQALWQNSSGTNNTGIGEDALWSNGLGISNTSLGDSSLYANTSGSYNVASGYWALVANTTGSDNTAIGESTLYDNTTGSRNTALGIAAFPDGSSAAAIANWTGIGADVGSGASANNMVEIGNSSVTVIRGEVGFTTYSDQRIKENVTENVPGLDFITKLRPVTYNLNIHKENAIMHAGGNKPDTDFPGKYDIEKMRMTGFIAQEVDKAAQATGYDFSGVVKPSNANDLYSLRYSDFVVPLVKAVQEQQQQIEDLKKLVETLQKQVQQQNNK